MIDGKRITLKIKLDSLENNERPKKRYCLTVMSSIALTFDECIIYGNIQIDE